MVDTIKNSPEYERLINSPTNQKRREHYLGVLRNFKELDAEILENTMQYVEKSIKSEEAAKEILLD